MIILQVTGQKSRIELQCLPMSTTTLLDSSDEGIGKKPSPNLFSLAVLKEGARGWRHSFSFSPLPAAAHQSSSHLTLSHDRLALDPAIYNNLVLKNGCSSVEQHRHSAHKVLDQASPNFSA